MIIAQITDLHVVARDRLCCRKVPTSAQLAQSIAHLNSLEPRPDAVIASGNLTDHGHPEECEVLRETLSYLIPPVFVILGNHDRRDILLRAFAGEDYTPPPKLKPFHGRPVTSINEQEGLYVDEEGNVFQLLDKVIPR